MLFQKSTSQKYILLINFNMENKRDNLRLCKVSFEEILIYVSKINCLESRNL